MKCGRCGVEIELEEQVFAVRETQPSAEPRRLNDVIPVDEYGLIIHDWKVNTICKQCCVERISNE